MSALDERLRFIDYLIVMLLVGVLSRQCTLQNSVDEASAAARNAAFRAAEAKAAAEAAGQHAQDATGAAQQAAEACDR